MGGALSRVGRQVPKKDENGAQMRRAQSERHAGSTHTAARRQLSERKLPKDQDGGDRRQLQSRAMSDRHMNPDGSFGAGHEFGRAVSHDSGSGRQKQPSPEHDRPRHRGSEILITTKDSPGMRQPSTPLGRGPFGASKPIDDADLSDEGEAEVTVKELTQLEEGHIRQIGSIRRWQRGNLIGSGSYGKVYLGMNLDSGELFVVKQVVFQTKEQNEDVMQLEQEIALLATLDHENIVKYLGTERNNITNELSIFLEHMPGGSVADLVKRFGGLDESVVRKYTREVLEGLMYLHNRGIIHRDIKGQNILVDNRGVCKLADFGASRNLQSTNSVANMSFKGTPVFMSPEVIMEQKYSKKSDVWSVGCTVLQMATGNPPFSEFSNHIAALFHITSNTEPPPLPDKLSEEAKDFVLNCFTREPSKRPFVDALRLHRFCRRPGDLKGQGQSSRGLKAVHESTTVAPSPSHRQNGSLNFPPPSANVDDEEQWKKYKVQMQEFKVTARLKRDRSRGGKSRGSDTNSTSDTYSTFSREGFGGARTDGYDGADEDDVHSKGKTKTKITATVHQRPKSPESDGGSSVPDNSWTAEAAVNLAKSSSSHKPNKASPKNGGQNEKSPTSQSPKSTYSPKGSRRFLGGGLKGD